MIWSENMLDKQILKNFSYEENIDHRNCMELKTDC